MTKPSQGFLDLCGGFFQKSSKLGVQPMCYVYIAYAVRIKLHPA